MPSGDKIEIRRDSDGAVLQIQRRDAQERFRKSDKHKTVSVLSLPEDIDSEKNSEALEQDNSRKNTLDLTETANFEDDLETFNWRNVPPVIRQGVLRSNRQALDVREQLQQEIKLINTKMQKMHEGNMARTQNLQAAISESRDVLEHCKWIPKGVSSLAAAVATWISSDVGASASTPSIPTRTSERSQTRRPTRKHSTMKSVVLPKELTESACEQEAKTTKVFDSDTDWDIVASEARSHLQNLTNSYYKMVHDKTEVKESMRKLQETVSALQSRTTRTDNKVEEALRCVREDYSQAGMVEVMRKSLPWLLTDFFFRAGMLTQESPEALREFFQKMCGDAEKALQETTVTMQKLEAIQTELADQRNRTRTDTLEVIRCGVPGMADEGVDKPCAGQPEDATPQPPSPEPPAEPPPHEPPLMKDEPFRVDSPLTTDQEELLSILTSTIERQPCQPLREGRWTVENMRLRTEKLSELGIDDEEHWAESPRTSWAASAEGTSQSFRHASRRTPTSRSKSVTALVHQLQAIQENADQCVKQDDFATLEERVQQLSTDIEQRVLGAQEDTALSVKILKQQLQDVKTELKTEIDERWQTERVNSENWMTQAQSSIDECIEHLQAEAQQASEMISKIFPRAQAQSKECANYSISEARWFSLESRIGMLEEQAEPAPTARRSTRRPTTGKRTNSTPDAEDHPVAQKDPAVQKDALSLAGLTVCGGGKAQKVSISDPAEKVSAPAKESRNRSRIQTAVACEASGPPAKAALYRSQTSDMEASANRATTPKEVLPPPGPSMELSGRGALNSILRAGTPFSARSRAGVSSH